MAQASADAVCLLQFFTPFLVLPKASLCFQRRFHVRLQKSNLGLGNLAKDSPVPKRLCLIPRALLVELYTIQMSCCVSQESNVRGSWDPKWAEGEKESKEIVVEVTYSLFVCVFSVPGHSLFT